MKIEDYCKNVSNELSKWRDEIHKENEKIAKLSSADKQHMHAVVEDLMMLETEMNDRLMQLKNECSVAWQPENVDEIINPSGSITSFGVSAEDSEKYIGEGNFGG